MSVRQIEGVTQTPLQSAKTTLSCLSIAVFGQSLRHGPDLARKDILESREHEFGVSIAPRDRLWLDSNLESLRRRYGDLGYQKVVNADTARNHTARMRVHETLTQESPHRDSRTDWRNPWDPERYR